MEPAARSEKKAAQPTSGIDHAVEAQAYLNCIEHHLGIFTAAVAGCRSAVVSLQEELSASNAVLFHQMQNPTRSTIVYETLLQTNGNMAKEIEHLLRVNANYQADAGRWNMDNENLLYKVHQLSKQILEKDCEISRLKGCSSFTQMLDESGEGMVQSPLSTSPPTQISKLSDSELASESEQCRCPDGEVAKIGMFIGAVAERNSSHIQPTKPGEAVTNQCNPNAPEAVGQSLSINEEKPILRRKRKQGLTGGGSETIREKPNERQKLTLLPC